MQDKPYKSVLIVGCGYIGRRVAKLLQAAGCRVNGSVRSEASRARLKDAGIDASLLDLDQPDSGHDTVSSYDAILYLAPPQPEGDRDLRMQVFLRLLDTRTPPRRMVYISTSAVYGDCQGAWITESQPVNPATARGYRRLDAEQQLREWCAAHAVQWMLLRVPGIYGPGKLPLARLRKGTPVLSEADSPYTNRIHGDDLAAICVAALTSPHANEIYNVSDGHPSNMTDYFFRAADAAGLPRPPVVDRDEAGRVLTKGMLSFLNDSRRMGNDKLLNELDVSLTYPDLDAGLKSCFKD
jgi:nucleoside-diphosphate-sugar epimerase